jgi:hypothetical protein
MAVMKELDVKTMVKIEISDVKLRLSIFKSK